jgi:surfeit locus 1 family protein
VTAKLRLLLLPGLMTAAMLAVLLALGIWQIERLHWKEAVLAQIARAEAGPAAPLPEDPQPYSKAQVTGRLRDDLAATYGADVRDTPAGTRLGTQLIVPMERKEGDIILVDRGWVPDSRPQAIAQPAGEVTVEGYVRPGDRQGMFSAPDNAATRQFYTLDPIGIGAALGLHNVAPFVLVAIGPAPPERYPDPARHLPRPPNNHLSYAITWFGLAFALVVIFVLWARKVLTA